jgi:hypothetical protein
MQFVRYAAHPTDWEPLTALAFQRREKLIELYSHAM